jgi:hypothetical protein
MTLGRARALRADFPATANSRLVTVRRCREHSREGGRRVGSPGDSDAWRKLKPFCASLPRALRNRLRIAGLRRVLERPSTRRGKRGTRKSRGADYLDREVGRARDRDAIGIELADSFRQKQANVRVKPDTIGERELNIRVGRPVIGAPCEHNILMARRGTRHSYQFSLKRLPAAALFIGQRVELCTGHCGDCRHWRPIRRTKRALRKSRAGDLW